jgi:type IV pilus assembly protein PilC
MRWHKSVASLYYYTARDVHGAFIRGSMEAGTASAALANLRARSLHVTSLENAATTRGSIAALLHIGGVSPKSLVTFFRSFSVLVRAGVAIRRSLDVAIAQCTDRRLREALSFVGSDIDNGLALSEAMGRHPKEFPRFYVAMIRAGEVGGVLDDVLERIASVLERDYAMQKRLSAALTYPAVVMCAAVGLILFLLTTIVPMFRSMYDQLHVPLPPITAALITVGSALQSPVTWALCVAVFAIVALMVMRLRSGERSGVAFDTFFLALPVAGIILRKSTLARFARMLGTLLRAGVGLVAALETVMHVVASATYRESITQLREALGAGALISDSLSPALYEPVFLQMLRVGEETGALDTMLVRIAEYYELDVETMISTLGAMLEPAMILLLGGAVGFIVAAVFIPLYTLIGNIK